MGDYNLDPARGPRTLLGNWSEDRTLESLGELARVPGYAARAVDTAARILPSSRSDRVAGDVRAWDSETRHASKAVLAKATASGVGPRAALLARRVREEADAYASTMLTPRSEAIPGGTTTGTTYVKHPTDSYRSSPRRPPPATVFDDDVSARSLAGCACPA